MPGGTVTGAQSLSPEGLLTADPDDPTYPNRLVLYSGTSGGITTNGVNQNGSLNYPCILDLTQCFTFG